MIHEDDRTPDHRFRMIREALVALGYAPADDRQEQARRALRILEIERAQREEEGSQGA
jgi:hypothetical protein